MAYNAVYNGELVIADEILQENIRWFVFFFTKNYKKKFFLIISTQKKKYYKITRFTSKKILL